METAARPFTLDGGPDHGRALIVEPCRHGNWPDMVPTYGGTRMNGRYRYDEATDTYSWIEL